MQKNKYKHKSYANGISVDKILVDSFNDHIVDATRYLTDNNAWFLADQSQVKLEFRKPTFLVPPALAESAREIMEKTAMGVLSSGFTPGWTTTFNDEETGAEIAQSSTLDAIVQANANIASRNIENENA